MQRTCTALLCMCYAAAHAAARAAHMHYAGADCTLCVLCCTAALAACVHSTAVHSTVVRMLTVHHCVLCSTAASATHMRSTTVLVPTMRYCVLCYAATYDAILQDDPHGVASRRFLYAHGVFAPVRMVGGSADGPLPLPCSGSLCGFAASLMLMGLLSRGVCPHADLPTLCRLPAAMLAALC
jgi:hypothetical protein